MSQTYTKQRRWQHIQRDPPSTLASRGAQDPHGMNHATAQSPAAMRQGDAPPTEAPIDISAAEHVAKGTALAAAQLQTGDPWVLEGRAAPVRNPARLTGGRPRRPSPALHHPSTLNAAHGMTPTILGRRDTVAVLVQAPFDTWYDQWMLQVDDADDAANPAGVDYFDDAVRMLESAAIGMAVAALRAHFDAHQADYTTASVTLLVEPRIPQDDALVCLLGVLESIHEEGEGWREDGELSFVETIAHDALAGMAYRAAESPFPAAVFAPGDPFFSAVDDSALLSDATLADVQAHPEWYALVDVQVTTLYARVQLLDQASDDPAARALTA